MYLKIGTNTEYIRQTLNVRTHIAVASPPFEELLPGPSAFAAAAVPSLLLHLQPRQQRPSLLVPWLPLHLLPRTSVQLFRQQLLQQRPSLLLPWLLLQLCRVRSRLFPEQMRARTIFVCIRECHCKLCVCPITSMCLSDYKAVCQTVLERNWD